MSSGWNSPEQGDAGSVPADLESVDGGVVDLPEDVYARILQQVREIHNAVGEVTAEDSVTELAALLTPGAVEVAEVSAIHEPQIPTPVAPEHLKSTGLGQNQLADLALKMLYLTGTSSLDQLSHQLKLPATLISDVTIPLQLEHHVEIFPMLEDSPGAERLQLTESGRSRARDAFARCRYVGPAPVSLADYTRQCLAQTISTFRVSAEQLDTGFADLVLSAEFLKRLGPALCSGQSILLSGPSGNGKTSIAKRLARLVHDFGGTIFVPYAITFENQIISVFDPTYHHPVENVAPLLPVEEHPGEEVREKITRDLRWREVRRPSISLGTDFEADMLKLKFHSESGYYSAPVHVKANGGVLFLDELGRQQEPAARLLNLWSQPLEERTDLMRLSSGKSFSVPVDQLTIFATNLSEEKVCDSALLRRIRHKIQIENPTEEQFREIFRRCCQLRNIKYDNWIVSRLLTSQYQAKSPPMASDPQLLLDVVEAICRFRGERPHLSEKIVFEAFQDCFDTSQAAR